MKMLLDMLFRRKYHPDPIVRDNSSSNRGAIEILVGHHVIELSEEQARNLWGELGDVLRKRKSNRPSGMTLDASVVYRNQTVNAKDENASVS